MSAILIECNPERLIREAASQAAHELTHVARAFTRIESPVDAPFKGVIDDEQIEQATCFLRSQEHQFLGGGVAATTISFHGDGFHIKE